MAIKYRGKLPVYGDYYHFVGATKYRKEIFLSKEKRERLEQMVKEVLLRGGECEIVGIAVAYNHIHVLLKTKRELSKVGMVLFGATSRFMRQEYPELKDEIKNGLWGENHVRILKMIGICKIVRGILKSINQITLRFNIYVIRIKSETLI